MKRYLIPILIFILISGFFTVSGDEAKKIANNYTFQDALELSQILDRQFIFTFVSASCPHCQEFKDNILSDPDVREILNKHFVLSLVSVDETFKLELPSQGEVTNMQLASGLGIKGTPTTFVFYPPNPELLREGGGITKFSGTPPKPKSMVKFLNQIVTESFKEEDNGKKASEPKYFNYSPSVKKISEKDVKLLMETQLEIPVIEEKADTASLPDVSELIIDFSQNSGEGYADKVLAETGVQKVFLVAA